MGTLGLSFAYADTTTISYISSAINSTYKNANITPVVNTNALSNALYNFSFFFPDIAAIACILLIIESWMLSFFIKAHPLAAVGATAMLTLYTIGSFYVSNVAIQIARLAIFSGVVSSSNLLFLIWLNMPVILVIAGVVDIAIALSAAR
jgi:hypothetical protein